MEPDKIAEGRDENSQQFALIVWKQRNMVRFPELEWLHHIPNGGKRGDSKRSAQIAGNEMKGLGVTPGVLDLFLPVPRYVSQLDHGIWGDLVTPVGMLVCGLYVEMKRPGAKSETSDDQKKFIAKHRQLGYACVVCDTYYEAKFYIESYLGIET